MQQKTKDFIENLRAFRGYIITAFVILVLLLIFGVVTNAGNQLMSAVGLGEVGTIEVVVESPNTRIFLDDQQKAVSTKEDEHITLSGLTPGKHTVLASRPGYYPWMKTVTLAADSTQTLYPFLISHSLPAQQIAAGTTRHQEVMITLSNAHLPTRDEPITSPSETIQAWIENDAVYARWIGATSSKPATFCPGGQCQDTITVTPSKAPIENIAFYKTQDRAVVIAAQNGIYALEVDPRGSTQNFQPIYEGDDPQFIKSGTSSIIVEDNGQLQQISL